MAWAGGWVFVDYAVLAYAATLMLIDIYKLCLAPKVSAPFLCCTIVCPGLQGDARRGLTLTWQEYVQHAWNVLSWINFAIFGWVFYLLLLVDMGVAGIEVASSFLLHHACMRISMSAHDK
jgi:hypothetical protein